MSEVNHDRITEILQRALQAPASRRLQVVADACLDDADLRRAVESLLSSYDGRVPSPGYESFSPTTYSPDEETSPAPERPHAPPGSARTWGGFLLLEELGRGGFGIVYRAWDATLKRDVALKIISVQRLRTSDDDAVLREGQLMARVRHENVVAIFSAQRIGDEIGLAMEYIKGRTLATIVAEGGPLGAYEAALIGVRVCDALAAVHRVGLVHRDLKASNVMRESGGRIVLMDFGAGRELGTGLGGGLEILGTPAYMPPEVLLGSRGTPASDIYSLGVLLYNLVTGAYPIRGNRLDEMRMAHIGGERHSLAEQRSDLPDAFVAAVDKALSADPASRHATAIQLKRDLVQAISPLRDVPVRSRPRPSLTDPKPRPEPEPAPAPARRRGLDLLLTIGGVSAAGLVFCAALGFLTTVAFNTALGRSGEFAVEGAWAYPMWGARAIVGPVIWMLLVLMVANAFRFVGRLLTRGISAVARARERLRQGRHRLAGRVGLTDVSSRLQALTIVGLALLAVIVWAFRGLIGAYMSTVNDAPASVLQMLSGDYNDVAGGYYDMRVLYRRCLELVILLFGLPLLQILRKPSSRSEAGVSAIASGVAVIVIALVLLVAPWRLMFKAQFPQAHLDGASCYVIGEHDTRVLVHCPSLAAPRNRVVQAGDPRLQRADTAGTVFNGYRAQAGSPRQ